MAQVIGLPEEIVGDADLKEEAETDIKNNTQLRTKFFFSKRKYKCYFCYLFTTKRKALI